MVLLLNLHMIDGRNIPAYQQDSAGDIAISDTLLQVANALPSDTILAESDTLTSNPDSIAQTPPKDKPSGIDDVVAYTARDSVVFKNGNMAYMFGGSKVNYQKIEVLSEEISINLDESTVYAVGVADTAGVLSGTPVFKDGSGEYESETMKYNFKTEKGYITNVVTQQGEGYLVANETKKNPDGDFFICDGKYTTCDKHDHPHFYLQLTRAKMRPGKNVVSGPAYMVLGDIPLPIAVPFGFFPITEKYSSGIIMPTFGEETTRGLYFRNGGYYFALSDMFDLALTGEVYTKGSWGLEAQSAYKKRYKFTGYLKASYITTVTGDKGLPDYQKQTNFSLDWSHTQDSKASQYLTFSAAVDFATSGYNRNSINTYYDASSFTENSTSSSVNLTYKLPKAPVSLSVTGNVTQRSSDSTLAVTLPTFTASVSRIYPFKRKQAVGAEKWYEKISFTYTGLFRNTITAKQDEILQQNLLKDWSNGLQHTVPVSATFTAFKYLNITPSFTFVDKMYTSKIMQQWDPRASAVVSDTTYGFYNIYTYSGSVSLQTKIYGFYQPKLWFGGKKINAIRHVMTPSVTFTGAPDFGSSRFGYWQQYTQINTDGSITKVDYSPFSHGTYGSTSQGKQGIVSLSLVNNLEMKVNTDRDTTGVKKISLIESLTTSWSYNMAADSLNWSNISMSLLIKLFQGFNLQTSFTFDPYTYQLNSSGSPVKVDVPRWKVGKGLGRLSSTGTSYSYTFNNATFAKWFNKDADVAEPPLSNNGEPITNLDQLAAVKEEIAERQKEKEKNNENTGGLDTKDGYMKWKIPWSLSINYSIAYSYGDFNYNKLEYDGKITQNLSFAGNIQPTENWTFTMSTSYDFDAKQMAYMSCGVTRDMHCWSMSCNFVPTGIYRSLNFQVNVKAAMLSDLKYTKSSSAYDNEDWY